MPEHMRNEELEKAEREGTEALLVYAREHGCMPKYVVPLIGKACRYGGPEAVRILLEEGRRFSEDPDTPRWELMLLADAPPEVSASTSYTIPEEKRLEIVRLLHDTDACSLSSLLFHAILSGDYRIAEELLALGTVLTAEQAEMVTGAAWKKKHRPIYNSRQMWDSTQLREKMKNDSNEDIVRKITLLRKSPDVPVVDVAVLDLYESPRYEKRVRSQFLEPEMLDFLLKNTTMPRIVNRRRLMEQLVTDNNPEGVAYALASGRYNGRLQIDLLTEVLEDFPGMDTEIRAMLLEHIAAHQPKNTLDPGANPFAAYRVGKQWTYKSCADGKEVCLNRYKGDSLDVVVPPRVGKRPVTEISERAFALQWDDPPRTFRSVSFPGSIRVLPQCLGGAYRESNVESVRLGDGMVEITDGALMCTNIRELEIPNSVKKIGEGALMECMRLQYIRWPKHLKSIPATLCYHCLSLKEADVPHVRTIGTEAFARTGIRRADISKAETVGVEAFEWCEALSDVRLSPQLREIPYRMFGRCRSLKAIPDCPGVEEIGREAFSESGIQEAILGPGVTRIGEDAFRYCKELTLLRIEGDVQKIPARMCFGCEKLSGVALSASLKTIGDDAFAGTGIESIEIPAGVTVGMRAFEQSKLREVRISGTATLDIYMFNMCHELRTVRMEEGITWIPESAFAATNALKTVQLPKTLRKIERNAFAETGLKQITLPETLDTIEIEAFFGSALESIRIPDGIEVGHAAFANCQSLTEVQVGRDVQLGRQTFAGNERLKSITLSSNMPCIPAGLCKDCTSLESVQIPDTVQSIEDAAFENTGLREIVIPPSVRAIGSHAFAGTQIERVVIPDSVTEIGVGAFARCAGLREVVLPAGLEKIPPELFAECASLETITLPESLRSIGRGAFMESGLVHIQIPDKIREIQGFVFCACQALEEVKLPEGLIEIGSAAFGNCTALPQIHLPGTLRHIASEAFAMSGLTHIRIPASVDTVETDAFAGCVELTEAVIENPATEIGLEVFADTPVEGLTQTF